MEIVVSTHHLGFGGSESYVLTVAEQFERLGHGVTIFALETGPSARLARERGLEVHFDEGGLPGSCDVILANDSVTAYQLADHYPGVPQTYVVHADEYDLSVPPQLTGLVQAVVVLNERVERRVRALAHAPEIVRLCQPVDTQRFRPAGVLRSTPRRALLFGNYVTNERRDLVFRACADAGIECVQVGVTGGNWTDHPELEILKADIVIGKARTIIEAMACGRAAYVYDHNGGDGWVTPERYPVLEADNFGGQAEPTIVGPERFRADLRQYTPEMGPANRDLAVARHSANKHAQQLVTLFQRLAPSAIPNEVPLREMARLVRLQWLTQYDRDGWQHEAQRLAQELREQRAQSRPTRSRAIRRFAVKLGARRARAFWRKRLARTPAVHRRAQQV